MLNKEEKNAYCPYEQDIDHAVGPQIRRCSCEFARAFAATLRGPEKIITLVYFLFFVNLFTITPGFGSVII